MPRQSFHGSGGVRILLRVDRGFGILLRVVALRSRASRRALLCGLANTSSSIVQEGGPKESVTLFRGLEKSRPGTHLFRGIIFEVSGASFPGV